jgi:hypothetical protein
VLSNTKALSGTARLIAAAREDSDEMIRAAARTALEDLREHATGNDLRTIAQYLEG